MSKSIYDELSEERKELQATGRLPTWFTTGAWQLLKEKYVSEEYPDYYSIAQRVASSAAAHMGKDKEHYTNAFFNIIWNGYLALSTPVLANMGTDRGCPVSCSGNYVEDSIYGFYTAQVETAQLTKNGFGTSSYLGDVRPRKSRISAGGNSSGVLPVIRDFVQLSRDVSQGNTRRGAWAGYIDVEGDDFWEVADELFNHPDDFNIGWLVHDSFIERLDNGDEDALARYQKVMKIRTVWGKGYLVKIDTINRANPTMYAEHGLSVKASNLCTEITLHSDEFHTFTCVLSSMNLSKYDEWKETDAVQIATIFLDCVAEEFIRIGRGIKGLEKAVRFTESGRALGLGALGFHTYLQKNMLSLESMEALYASNSIFKHINKEATIASKRLAKTKGEPKWCKGTGMRNTHLLAIAPNSSSALVCGGVSQGIEPVYKNVYVQGSPAGEINRINPVLLDRLKSTDRLSDAIIKRIIDNNGSIQGMEEFTEDEQRVFKTSFEWNQEWLLRLASSRQQYICQAQSLNLFFSSDESEEEISRIHKIALKDERIKSLYYLRTESGVKASTGECVACEG